MYWNERGPGMTEQTAAAAIERARQLGIKHVVVASNTGYTADFFLGKVPNLVVVTHHTGFREPGHQELPEDARRRFEAGGAKVLTTTHLFANIERSITSKFGGLYPGGIVAATLRLFGQGPKVCLEIATMALDAGLIPHGQEIVAVGGTGRGADTAMVLIPAHSNVFFEGKVLEIICKPRHPR
ncbi:MAG: pyruvate kinase alpha/beta domain-containing protein [Bacillota bacterium]